MTDPVNLVLRGKPHDLGDGFVVRRALPQIARRAVGPFVFFDHMGPVDFAPGKGIDVRPHPHIGLATVTYLFDGEIVHRDSLGMVQPIRPGDVNWMVAGRGIVHSERTGDAVRAAGGKVHGLQIWVGLPTAREEDAPSFRHYPGASLPVVVRDGVQMRIVAGEVFGARSPVETQSTLFYADCSTREAATIEAPREFTERAVYVIDGAIDIGEQSFANGDLVVLSPGIAAPISSRGASRFMLLGGEPLDGPRHMWWNFVASSRERIERAKSDWAEGRFAKVPGESEFIPLPL